MVLCKPYLAPEPDRKDEAKRKVCERDGRVYENKYFRVLTPESWGVMSRLKGALTKDKYRIQAISPNNQADLVIAQSDNYDEMVTDWKLITDEILPMLVADPNNLQNLPEIVMKLKQSTGGARGSELDGSAKQAASPNPTPAASKAHPPAASSGAPTSVTDPVSGDPGAFRRPSKSAVMLSQRDQFNKNMQSLQASAQTQTRQDLGDLEIHRTLGTGSFGRVVLAKEQSANRWCAMKIIRKDVVIKLKQVEHTLNEKNILSCIDCPFIIHLWEFFQDKRSLYFVMEFVNGGELFTHIHRNRYFTFEVARFFAAETVLAFEYLHNLDIVYRDLKPENMLLDHRGHLRITDFGFAKRVTDRTWTLCGTPEYLAPEIILSKGYAHAVDWWALGILIYEMRCGHAPFYDPSQMEMYKKIVEGKLLFPQHFKQEERTIIQGLLTKDLTFRLGAMRGGAQDIKEHPYFKGILWDALYNMEVPSPYVPKTSGENDTSNFDRYDEEKIMWAGDPSPTDSYYEIFKNF